MNNDVNANFVIAEGLDARGFPEALAWEPAKRCPKGHPNRTPHHDGPTPIGEPCNACLMSNIPDEYRTRGWEWAMSMQAAMAERPGLHDEWRIGRVPHRFTNPTYLLPVINALGDQPDVIDIALRFHRNHSSRFWEGTLELYVSTPSGREATTQVYEGSGPEWGDAVADALRAVVMGEEVGRDS